MEVPGSSPFHPGNDSGSSMYLLADSQNLRTQDKLTKHVTHRHDLRRTVLRMEESSRAPTLGGSSNSCRTRFQVT